MNAQAHPFAAIAEAVPAFGAAIRRHDAGDLAGARAAYLELVDQPGLTALCIHQLALLHAARGENARAAEMFRQAVRLDPSQPLAYHNLSSALDRLGDRAGAVAVLVDLVGTYYRLGDRPQCVHVSREILKRDPLNYAAEVNLGTTLAWMGELPEAAFHLIRALRLYGRLVPEVASIAVELEERLAGRIAGMPERRDLPDGMPNGAIEKIEDCLTTLGKVLYECCCPDEAIMCHRLSVALAPNYVLGHWNLSLALLECGDFTNGWREYEWRWHWDMFPEPRRLLRLPTWRGEPLAGRAILVWGEQGYGDAIQFAPLVSRLREMGAKVVLEVPTPLVRLFANSFEDVTVIGRPDSPHALSTDQPLDYVVPLMSLPDRLGLQPEDLPLAVDYLRATPEDLAVWAKRLPKIADRRAGIVWGGRVTQADNVKRSIPFDTLRPLFDVKGVRWHSLQVGPAEDELTGSGLTSIENLAPELKDFGDTVAAISQLDLVVTVCTGVAHLSAAMGKPVWLMARKPTDWRWRGDQPTSPWYPSMYIFRQKTPGDWAEVIERVVQRFSTSAD